MYVNGSILSGNYSSGCMISMGILLFCGDYSICSIVSVGNMVLVVW